MLAKAPDQVTTKVRSYDNIVKLAKKKKKPTGSR
jgi:hypothetical protein